MIWTAVRIVIIAHLFVVWFAAGVWPAFAEGPAGYQRSNWRHWIADEHGVDTRNKVLERDRTCDVVWQNIPRLHIVSGCWTDPWTGDEYTDPRHLDIDHQVPLANAYASGGAHWSRERKQDYANDLSWPGHLRAISASANRSKGKLGPDEWRPRLESSWCEYALTWTAVKRQYDLTSTDAEQAALSEMLATCDFRVGWSEE